MKDKLFNLRKESKPAGVESSGAKIIEIYDDLLRTVWQKILPTLGIVTVMTITRRAIEKAALKHPYLDNLEVGDNGIIIGAAEGRAWSDEELKDSFKALVSNIFDILAKLTGNILVNQLMREVEGIELD